LKLGLYIKWRTHTESVREKGAETDVSAKMEGVMESAGRTGIQRSFKICDPQQQQQQNTHTQRRKGSKGVPANPMKAQEGKKGTTPMILNLSIRWR